MAKMHSSVVSASGDIIARRIDENFGLSTSAPTALAISTYTLDISSLTESSTFYIIGAGTIKIITGGQVGQRVTLMSATGGSVVVHNSTGGTGENIRYQAATGSITISNVYHSATLLKTNTGTYAWTVTGSKTT